MSVCKLPRHLKEQPPLPLPADCDPIHSLSDLSNTSRNKRAVQVAMLISMPSAYHARPEYVLGVVEARLTRRSATV